MIPSDQGRLISNLFPALECMVGVDWHGRFIPASPMSVGVSSGPERYSGGDAERMWGKSVLIEHLC